MPNINYISEETTLDPTVYWIWICQLAVCKECSGFKHIMTLGQISVVSQEKERLSFIGILDTHSSTMKFRFLKVKIKFWEEAKTAILTTL